MKKPLFALPLAAALLVCGCTPAPESTAPASSASPEAATPSPTETPEATAPAGLTDAGLGVLDYDEIRAICRDTQPYFLQMDGYYTMSRDGLWGLMRTDGTEVLACQSSVPLSGCASADLRWHSPLEWECLASLTAQLQVTGDG